MDPVTISLYGLVLEAAKTIADRIQSAFKANTVEGNNDKFLNSCICYHSRVRKLVQDTKGATKLASDINNDRLFCYYISDEDTCKISNALEYLQERKITPLEKMKIISALTRYLEQAKGKVICGK